MRSATEKTTWTTVAAAAALALVLVAPGRVVAQPPTTAAAPPSTAPAASVTAQVVVILAREDGGTIDPRLEGLSALREPPFNAFHSMEVAAEHPLTLTQGVPVTFELPNGRIVQLVLEEITPDGRNHVRVSINRRDQSDYLPVLEVAAPPGDPFFVAGQTYLGGTLVIGVSLGRGGVTPTATRPPTPRPHIAPLRPR
jgi:hypothetical protein